MPRSREAAQAFDHQHRIGARHGRRGPVERDFAANHHLGEVVRRRVVCRQAARHPAKAQDGDPVADLGDLGQLVADEHDPPAFGREVAHDPEQAANLRGGEDRGRLVEHEESRPAEDRLEDLQPLLRADRHLPHGRVRVDVELVLCRELDEAPPSGGEVEQQTAIRAHAEDHVLNRGQVRHEHELLVDHADPVRDGLVGGGDRDRLPVEQDLAGIGLVEAVEHLHEGALARAVLAQQRMDLADANIERDGVVREQPAEPLRDPVHPQELRGLAAAVLQPNPPTRGYGVDDRGGRTITCRLSAVNRNDADDRVYSPGTT